MNECENIDFMLPYRDFLLKFIPLSQNDKLKVVQLGLSCFNASNIQSQLWNNEEWEKKMKTLQLENIKLKEEYKFELLEKEQKIERIIKNNKEQNELFCDDIKKRTETKYKADLIELKNKVQYLQDKSEGIYRETVKEFQEKSAKERVRQEEKIEKIRTNYEKKLEKERELRDETIKRKSYKLLLF